MLEKILQRPNRSTPDDLKNAVADFSYSKKHQKRLSAPSHWLLDKLSGVYAPKPSAGPHKLRDCMPLIVFIRNRLKYALNYRETKAILMQRLIKVDGKVRTDIDLPHRLHGRHHHLEDRRELPSRLRYQGSLHRPPNPDRGGRVQVGS